MKTIAERRAELLVGLRKLLAERSKNYIGLKEQFFDMAGQLDSTKDAALRNSLEKTLEAMDLSLSDMSAGLDEEEAELDAQTREIIAGINDRNAVKSAEFETAFKDYSTKLALWVSSGGKGSQPQSPATVEFEEVPASLKLTLRKPRGTSNSIKTV